jgi:PAS domain S-box-containing protein
MTAAKKKKPEEKGAGVSGSTRSLRDEAEKEIAHAPKISPDIANQTPEKLIHELQVHQIELEMQAEDLRRTHLTLEESRDKYLDLYEFAPLGYLTLTDKARITGANLTGATLLGVERNTLVNHGFGRFIAPGDLDLWDQYFIRVRNQGKKQTCTLTLIRGDGSHFPARLESTRLTVKSDGTTTIRVAISDITDISRAEEEIKFKNVILSTQQETSLDGILVVDKNGKILSFNRHFTELWDIPDDVIASRSDERALQYVVDKLADPEAFVARVTYLYNHKDEKSREEILLKDGRVLDRYSTSIVGQDKKYYGRVWYFRDITECKTAEETLRETNEYLHKLIDFASAPIIVWDPDFRITRFNHAFEHLTGRTEQEVIGQPLDILFPKESIDASLALIKKTLSGERWESVEIPILASDGVIRTVLWNSANILTAEAELISTIAQGVDITERKRAEEGLLESKEKYRLLIENANEAIMVAQDGMLKLVNRMSTELTGYPEQELTSKPFAGFIHPDDRAMVVENHTKRLRGDHISSRYQFRLLTSDESTKWVEMGVVMIDWEGRPASLNFLTDITERKRAEDKLRRSEEQYRTFIETANEGILSMDASLRIMFVNQKMAEMLGYSLGEITGKVITGFMYPEDLADNDLKMKERRNGKAEMYERRFRHRDGSVRWMLVSATPLMDNAGAFAGSFAMYTDITERKRAEETLRENEERFRTILHSMQTGIIVIDALTHTIIDVNQKSLDMIGGTKETVLGSICHSYICPAELGKCPITDLAQTIDNSERVLISTQGKKILILKSVIPTILGGKNVLIESFIDITERKRAEDMTALANRKLTLINDVTYQFIQNKVTGLRGYAELSKDAKTETERVSFIEKEERILADIHQLIKNTKDYQEMGVNQSRWIPLEQSIRIAVSIVSPKESISIEITLHGLELYSDPLIEKIFANLIDNAVKHGKTTTRITFSCEETTDGLILICEDDGVGISPKDKARLFDRSAGENIHFGLFFVRECLSLSGMTIAETGTPGKGARFEIHVPAGMWRMNGASV